MEEDRWALQDFRDAVHQPGRALLEGANPYDAAIQRARPLQGQDYPLYTPAHLLVHSPFALPAYGTARWLWFAFGLLLCLGLARLCQVAAGLGGGTATAILGAGLLLLSRPGHMNQVVGNLAWESALSAGLALHLARRCPRFAGLLLALAACKPTVGGPVGFLMLCRGDRRAVASGLVWSVALVGGGLLWLGGGPAGAFEVLEVLWEQHLSTGQGDRVGVRGVAESWARLDLAALAFYASGWTPGIPGQTLLSGLPLVLAGATLVRARSWEEAGVSDRSGALVLLGTLLCIYHQAYDAVLLAPVLAGVWVGTGWSRRLRTPLLILLAVPFVNYLATATALPLVGSPTLMTVVKCANPFALTLAFALVLVSKDKR